MCDFILMLLEVFNHSGKVELGSCDEAVSNHSICYGLIIPAVICGVADADDFAVGHLDFSGALDVSDVRFEGVGEPDKLLSIEEVLTFDLGARWIFSCGAVGHFSADDGAIRIFYKVGGLFIKGVFEFFGSGKGAFDNGSEIACEEDGAAVVAADRYIDIEILSYGVIERVRQSGLNREAQRIW